MKTYILTNKEQELIKIQLLDPDINYESNIIYGKENEKNYMEAITSILKQNNIDCRLRFDKTIYLYCLVLDNIYQKFYVKDGYLYVVNNVRKIEYKEADENKLFKEELDKEYKKNLQEELEILWREYDNADNYIKYKIVKNKILELTKPEDK